MRNRLGQFTAGPANRVVRAANQRSLVWLIDRTLTELEKGEKRTGRPAETRTGNLERAIRNPDNHARPVPGRER